MKKLLFALGLLGALASPALAVDPATLVGNVNYSILSTDIRIVPTVALTANRTWTLPSAGATCIGQGCGLTLDVIDQQGNVGGANSCLVFAPASGETINGSTSSITFCGTYGLIRFFPMSGTTWIANVISAGQLQGTTTNDNASAGYIGEVITTGLCPGSAATATITVTIAAPGVVTWTAHGITGACPVVFTTSGALPTGITSGTTYYVVPSSVTANTFQIATTVANALAGTSITTTGTQSGTQTGTGGVALATTTAATITGLSLTAGDWDCRGVSSHVLGASTSVTVLETSISAAATTQAAQGLSSTNFHQDAATVIGALGQDLFTGPFRISLAATTNEFLVETDTFTVSTNVGFGSLTCRRAR